MLNPTEVFLIITELNWIATVTSDWAAFCWIVMITDDQTLHFPLVDMIENPSFLMVLTDQLRYAALFTCYLQLIECGQVLALHFREEKLAF